MIISVDLVIVALVQRQILLATADSTTADSGTASDDSLMRSDAAPQDAGLVHGGLHGGTPAFRALRRHTRSLGAEVTGRSVPSPEHRHGHITASHAPAAAVRHLGKKLTVRRS